MELIFYTREGCCLCKGLEERLETIRLKEVNPFLKLTIKDIDGDEVSEGLRNRYSLEVPVLVLSLKEQSLTIDLPRVSPRLKKEALSEWLRKVVKEKMKQIDCLDHEFNSFE